MLPPQVDVSGYFWENGSVATPESLTWFSFKWLLLTSNVSNMPKKRSLAAILTGNCVSNASTRTTYYYPQIQQKHAYIAIHSFFAAYRWPLRWFIQGIQSDRQAEHATNWDSLFTVGENLQMGLQMMTSSNGNIFRVTDPLYGEITGYQWIPLTKANDAELDFFCNLRLNKRLSKQS